MKKYIHFSYLTLLLLLFVFIIAPPVSAQDETTTVALNDGYGITLPSDWEATVDDDFGGTIFTDGDITVYVLDPTVLLDIVEFDENTDPERLLTDVFDALYDEKPRRRDMEEMDFGERTALTYPYDMDGQEGLFILLPFNDALFGALNIFASDSTLDDALEVVEPIVISFDLLGDTATTADSSTAQGALSVVTSSSEPCFVSADEAETARLRVGPGENRTSVAFLPANEQFEVNGRFTDDDGNVWYQLDKEEAAPNSAAAEIWVAGDDVEESGDCESVVDASAPPIVPITSTNPEPPADTTTQDTTGGTTDTTGTTNTATAVPRAGYWTLILNPTTSASCTGSQSITIGTLEVWNDVTFLSYITVASDGSSITVDGDVFPRLNGRNSFNGSFTYDASSNAQLRVDVVSATYMTGQIVYNLVIDGVGCSTTTLLTMTHN